MPHDLVHLGDPPSSRQPQQESLFHSTTADILASTGASRVGVSRLHAAGLLSFDAIVRDPRSIREERELTFLCGLLAAGCDIALVRELVATLAPPYAYALGSMLYDFGAKRWCYCAPPRAAELGEAAVQQALDDEDHDALAELGHAAIRALAERAGREAPDYGDDGDDDGEDDDVGDR